MIVRTEGSLATDRTQLFGAEWCGDCRRTKSWLVRHDVPFYEYDTEADESSRSRAAAIAGGRKNIPVVITPNGTVLVEPTTTELASTLSGHRHRSDCR
ncbi:MAG: NrdH-redoxin [Pseudonocardiaceae bacterium]|nr:NrdH-redoxin [Pseudonocardiaceae bacterium]